MNDNGTFKQMNVEQEMAKRLSHKTLKIFKRISWMLELIARYQICNIQMEQVKNGVWGEPDKYER